MTFYEIWILVDTNLWSTAKQFTSTYLYHTWILKPNWIHQGLIERREAKAILICWLLKEEKHLVPGLNPKPPAHRASALPLRYHCDLRWKKNESKTGSVTSNSDMKQVMPKMCFRVLFGYHWYFP